MLRRPEASQKQVKRDAQTDKEAGAETADTESRRQFCTCLGQNAEDRALRETKQSSQLRATDRGMGGWRIFLSVGKTWKVPGQGLEHELVNSCVLRLARHGQV